MEGEMLSTRKQGDLHGFGGERTAVYPTPERTRKVDALLRMGREANIAAGLNVKPPSREVEGIHPKYVVLGIAVAVAILVVLNYLL